MALPEHLEWLARDCEITAFKSSGPGGQKKNKTESSIRVVHVPTGITRIATESRSQLRNKEAALERVWLEIQRRARKRKPRIATKPSKAAKDRRIQEKKRAGTIKRLRRTTDED
jgi:protein subunit release factor A